MGEIEMNMELVKSIVALADTYKVLRKTEKEIAESQMVKDLAKRYKIKAVDIAERITTVIKRMEKKEGRTETL
jgi:hypothetical protein